MTTPNLPKCVLCDQFPDVQMTPKPDRWIIACPCAKAVRVCGDGHLNYAEALACWNKIVAEITEAMKESR